MSESNRPLRVLMVASECLPLSKSGGLADVVAALPVALARRGHHVRIVVPRYRGVACDRAPVATIEVAVGPRAFRVPIYEHRLHDAVRVWLVDEPTLFGRTSMYGEGQTDYTDNALRFALLSKAALQCAITQAFRPHVVHAHDWHAGLVPLYMRTAFADSTLGGAASVFTIHNLAYQGLFDPSWLRAVGIDPRYYHADGLEYWGRMSFLKAGINYCDRLTTVSPGYAREMQTPAGGFGFDGIVRRRAECLTGILNGIDVEAWDPTTDSYLDAHFSIDTLDEKRHCKRALLERFAFTQARAVTRPVVGMVSRMVDQKGLDLIAGIASALPHLDATIVVHGTGEARYEEMWRNLAARWPDRIGVVVGFDERLAHLIEAGSDLWLMPSRFEPCGLNQMYSQRYGTVPVVRATGGLDDTVTDVDLASGTGTGFKFGPADPAVLLATLRRALKTYRDRRVWRRIQQAGMRKDFSWDRAAHAYEEVYALAGVPASAHRGSG